MKLQPNTLFHDRYFLQEMKGRGSFGEVWLARDEKLDIDVAVKVYIALDSRGVQEFTTEFKTAFGLNHPNLLHAYHYDTCEDRPYLVMPFCPSSAIDLIGNVDEPTMWHFIHDVASGLEYLHGMGIVHHDIKPDNIMRDADGKFLITDFGISVKFRSTLRRNSEREVKAETVSKGGSIPYMAPEMFSEEAGAVNATDIWALGVTMYEMMTGELPFFGQGGVMQQNGARIPEVHGDWSDDLKTIVKMCLEPQSWDRPSAKDLVGYAQMALNGEENIFPKEGKKTKSGKSGPKHGKLLAIIVLAVVVLGIGGFLLFPRPDSTPKPDPKPLVDESLRINATYKNMKTEALDMIDKGSNTDTDPWLEAKKEIDKMRLYEEQYHDQLASTASDSIQSLLDPKLKGAAEAWANAAKTQANIGENFKAIELYQAALNLYELPEARQAYNELKEQTIILE